MIEYRSRRDSYPAALRPAGRTSSVIRLLVLVAAVTGLFGASPLVAQDEAGMSASEVAKVAQNPIGTWYNFPFQNNTNFKVGPNDEQSHFSRMFRRIGGVTPGEMRRTALGRR